MLDNLNYAINFLKDQDITPSIRVHDNISESVSENTGQMDENNNIINNDQIGNVFNMIILLSIIA